VRLKHELWEEQGGCGYMVCLAGPRGDEARRLIGPGAKLLSTFEAGSYFEMMTAYYELMGWGEYETKEEFEFDPYPEEWAGE
jgi:hypothetical protein